MDNITTIDLLSYLNGQLSQADISALERSLSTSPLLRDELEFLRALNSDFTTVAMTRPTIEVSVADQVMTDIATLSSNHATIEVSSMIQNSNQIAEAEAKITQVSTKATESQESDSKAITKMDLRKLLQPFMAVNLLLFGSLLYMPHDAPVLFWSNSILVKAAGAWLLLIASIGSVIESRRLASSSRILCVGGLFILCFNYVPESRAAALIRLIILFFRGIFTPELLLVALLLASTSLFIKLRGTRLLTVVNLLLFGSLLYVSHDAPVLFWANSVYIKIVGILLILLSTISSLKSSPRIASFSRILCFCSLCILLFNYTPVLPANLLVGLVCELIAGTFFTGLMLVAFLLALSAPFIIPKGARLGTTSAFLGLACGLLCCRATVNLLALASVESQSNYGGGDGAYSRSSPDSPEPNFYNFITPSQQPTDSTGSNPQPNKPAFRPSEPIARPANFNPQLNLQHSLYAHLQPSGFNGEGYHYTKPNGFIQTKDEPFSTWSIDVDTASYSNVRRILNAYSLPPTGAVRTEELINYFSYNYPEPTDNEAIAVTTELFDAPWKSGHQLLRIALKGKSVERKATPASNLVLLIDVSGSMTEELPLVKEGLRMFIKELREIDKLGIVVYAADVGVALNPTSGAESESILQAIEALSSGGSTNGAGGIQAAYKMARENFSEDGNNRVILITDGDFNVGISSDDALVSLIETERESGVFLTVFGIGVGNYQDAKMEALANKGNGNYAYIDSSSEARKLFTKEFGGSFNTIAKDVKIQIAFNPTLVQEYRLLGYENRMLAKEDFDDDRVDAGELGAGQAVTALYEIVPVGANHKTANVSPSDPESTSSAPDTTPQGDDRQTIENMKSSDLALIKFRYKRPSSTASVKFEIPIGQTQSKTLAHASEDSRFVAAIAQFSMILRNDAAQGNSSYDSVIDLSSNSLGEDPDGQRREFVDLVRAAKKITSSRLAVE